MANAQAVMSMYDEPMWASIRSHALHLQQCDDCGRFRYPPAPNCPHCLSLSQHWQPVSGQGTILSWVVFHRQYFDDYPPPYNAVAVRLAEGPILISNLVGDEPEGSWIGRPVTLCYETDAAGTVIPKVRLAG